VQVRCYCIGMLLILTVSVATGQAQQAEPGKTTNSKPEKKEKILTLEFLEFLGEWETEDGRWIDPEELEQMSLPDPEPKKDEENEKN